MPVITLRSPRLRQENWSRMIRSDSAGQTNTLNAVRSGGGSSAIFWDASEGMFGFYGAGSGVPQLIIDTDGSIVAGSGAIELNRDGVTIHTTTNWDDVRAYRFAYGGTVHSQLRAYAHSTMNEIAITASEVSGKKSQTSLQALSPSGTEAIAQLQAQSSLGIFAGVSAMGTTTLFEIGQTGAGNVIEMYVPSGDIRTDGGLYVGGIGTDPDAGDVYIVDNCSAASFTDRTPLYEGNALEDLRGIRGHAHGLDHESLPAFARKTIHLRRTTDDGQIEDVYEDGRDLGAMVSILTRGMQQLLERVEQLERKQA